MNIHLYTLCWNEMDILPFVMGTIYLLTQKTVNE